MDDVLLNKAGIIERCLRRVAEEYRDDPARLDAQLAERLRRMVGFRNVAIHGYQALDVRILRSIVDSRLVDFTDLCAALGLRVRP